MTRHAEVLKVAKRLIDEGDSQDELHLSKLVEHATEDLKNRMSPTFEMNHKRHVHDAINELKSQGLIEMSGSTIRLNHHTIRHKGYTL